MSIALQNLICIMSTTYYPITYYILPVFHHALCDTDFQRVQAAKGFDYKYDVLTGFYRVGSYRKSYERECISAFMSPSDVLKILKIARAVGLIEHN